MLQQIIDICFAALALRTPLDENAFEMMVARTGARLTAVAGLEFAGNLFGVNRCLEIANAIKPVRYSKLLRALLCRSLATSTRYNRSVMVSWRRQIARELIKRG
jgi:hypothetical protein